MVPLSDLKWMLELRSAATPHGDLHFRLCLAYQDHAGPSLGWRIFEQLWSVSREEIQTAERTGLLDQVLAARRQEQEHCLLEHIHDDLKRTHTCLVRKGDQLLRVPTHER
jgi:hypothetical protein